MFKLKQYLHHYNIPWSGSKDQLALRVLALRTGTMHILCQRERDGLLQMIDVAEHVISAQKELKILSNEFVTRQRAFFTPEGSSLSSSRPREAAGQPCSRKNEKVTVPDGTTLSQLEDLFHNIEREIRLLNKDSAQKYDPYNLSAIRSSKGRVMVKWTDEDNKKGWKPGWYTAIIKNYITVCDVIEMEYVSEPGKVYKVNVRTVWKMEPYDSMSLHVGYQTFMTKLLKLVHLFPSNGSGWKAG